MYGGSEEDIRAKKIDILVLAFMGFFHVSAGRCAVASYAENDEQFVLAMNRLQTWCPHVRLADVRSVCPLEGLGPVQLNAEAATGAALAIKHLAKGKVVNVAGYTGIFQSNAALVDVLVSEISSTQPEVSQQVRALLGGHATTIPPMRGLTQAEEVEEEESDGSETRQRSKRLRVRPEPPLEASVFQDKTTLAKKMAMGICVTQSAEISVSKLKEMYKSDAARGDIEKTAGHVFRLMQEMGFAYKGGRGKSISLASPPADHRDHVLDKIATMPSYRFE